MAGVPLKHWHLITCEYPPQPGGVSGYSGQLAGALRAAGDIVQVWCGEFQGFTPAGTRRVGELLDASPGPARLLLQWVPHGYGYKSMNLGFCRWLAARKEPLDLVVHEPGLGFWEGGLRHNVVAGVHRAMLAILLRSASRVWGTTAGWEAVIRPYAFGRKVPFFWAPVPSNIPVDPSGPDGDYEAGYFGQYDAPGIRALLRMMEVFPGRVALIGRGAERVPLHPRTVVLGEMDERRLSRSIAACRVMCHHYIDGVSGRRTTAMASLAHGKPVATVQGRFTEPVWRGNVALCPAEDGAALAENLMRLLRDSAERERLGAAGLELYRTTFTLQRTVEKLRR